MNPYSGGAYNSYYSSGPSYSWQGYNEPEPECPEFEKQYDIWDKLFKETNDKVVALEKLEFVNNTQILITKIVSSSTNLEFKDDQ